MMENTISLVEEQLDGCFGQACLVRDQGGNYYVVSTITSAFRADESGNILDWVEVAGGGDMTRSDVLAALTRGDAYLSDEARGDEKRFDSNWYPEEDWEDWYREDQSLSEYGQSNERGV